MMKKSKYGSAKPRKNNNTMKLKMRGSVGKKGYGEVRKGSRRGK